MKARIIHVLCEGQTEQGFVEEVLRPYLLQHGITGVKSILITTNKKKNARGGMLTFGHAERDLDLLKRTKVDGDYEQHFFTTMFDFYALPNDFPGYKDSLNITDRYAKVEALEKAFADFENEARFILYIQLHEFEALVFCGIEYLKDLYPQCKDRIDSLKEDLRSAGNPELINNNPATAPSKRIIKVVEGDKRSRYNYNKPVSGKYVTSKVGIDELRARCRHFDRWIEMLINL